MKRSKKKKKEEISSEKTADLRNVIVEIQKVDQETADLSAVVEEVQRIDRKTPRDPKKLLTCRLLFSSIMDKIFIILLIIGFLVVTFLNFKGNIFGAAYGFWFRFLRELGIVVLFFILSLFFDWIYKCFIKTMLCVTPHSIYRECYFPFWRRETTIPIQHVTAVSTINIFWIFRCVVIYQYRHFPLIFFTWNNQVFKNQVDELLEHEPVGYNGASHKTIFRKKYAPIIQWIMIIVAFIIIVLGIVHFFGYIFSTEKRISGTYLKGNQKIQLNVNGTCSLRLPRITDLKSCKWKYDSEQHTIDIRYEFSKKNYFGDVYDTKDTITVGYKEDVLIYNGIDYKKK